LNSSFDPQASQGQGGSSSIHAKLGHGKKFGITRSPKRIESLNGISIEKVVCSEEATFCVSEQGDLFTFGYNLYGCLGLGSDFSDEEGVYENECAYLPLKIPFFHNNGLKIKSIACGDSHVICLTDNNRVFSWGCGEYGRLGTGDEDDRHEPTEVKFGSFGYTFKEVFAGPDTSFLLTEKGRVLAFGNNEFNKLCLNSTPVGFSNLDSKNKCIQVRLLH
jgi:NIMA (never in mitosis gene a)-related kinase